MATRQTMEGYVNERRESIGNAAVNWKARCSDRLKTASAKFIRAKSSRASALLNFCSADSSGWRKRVVPVGPRLAMASASDIAMRDALFFASERRASSVRCCMLAALTLSAMSAFGQGDRAVIVGMTTSLTGPNAPYGVGLLHGVRLGLAEAMPSGVELKVLDDAGDPQRAASNVQSLIDAGAVAITGVHGAGPAEAIRSLLARTGVPLVGVASSADTLRNPPQREIFNLRAGVGDEVDAIVLHLDTLGIDQVSALAEGDALGSSGLEGLKFQLTRLAIRPLTLESLPLTPPAGALNAAMRRICAASPQAVLLAVQAQQAVEAMRIAPELGCTHTRFVAVSETGAALALGGQKTGRLVVSQVLPFPSQIRHPLAAAYMHALGGNSKLASYPSIEGYLYGRVLGELVKVCGRHATSSCIVETLETRPPTVGGWRLHFGPNERRGARYVDLTLIEEDGHLAR